MSERSTPAISVVVPMYDVARYLGECLDSIAAQSFGDLEVLCVDDGSPDESGAIADAYARRDDRFRVIRQDNAGLGAARNAGARQAKGEYLAFVDSDDLVHPDAYATMIRSLERSGSDFVLGNVHRLTSLGLRQSPMFGPVCATTRTATHVSRDPVLFVDRIAPNKLFRRDFWTQHGFAFPEGVAYEDIAVIIPAHVLAGSVDVLSDHVYVWRQRSGADRSITQRRLEIPNMRDRFRAVTAASRFLAEGGYDAEKREYDRVAMADELRLFSSLLDRADEEYARDLVANGREFLSQAHPKALQDAPALERLKWHLIGEGAVEDVVRVARFDHVEADVTRAIVKRGRILGDLPFRERRRPRIPREVFEYRPELALETRITGGSADAESVGVEGWAYIRHAEVVEPRDQKLRLWLVDGASGDRLPMRVEPVPAPEATATARPDIYDYAGAGFRATVPTAQLADRWTSGVDRYRVEVEVTFGRITRTGPLSRPEPGAPRRAPFVDVGRLRIGARIEGAELTVVVAARPVTLRSAAARDDHLHLEVGSKRDLTDLRLARSGAEDLHAPLVPVDEQRFEARLPTAWFEPDTAGPLAPRDLTWTVQGVARDGKVARLVADVRADQIALADGEREVSLEITRYGNVSIGSRLPALWLQDVEVDGGSLRVVARCGGSLSQGGQLQLGLAAGDRVDRRWLPAVRPVDGRIEVMIPAVSFPTAGGDRPLPAATWSLTARHVADDGTEREVDLRLPRSLTARLPAELHVGRKRIAFDDLSWQRPAVVVGDDLEANERGRYHQRRLWRAAAAGAGQALAPAVLVVGAGGRRGGGDVGAVVDELRRRRPDLEVRLAVEDQQLVVPDGVTPVRVGGQEWHESLASAAFVVTDGPLPDHYRRADGQVCVMLWPGVPIRPVGLEAGALGTGEDASDEAILTAAGQWTHLVSPNAFATGILRRTFRPAGTLLEVGHPRHDVLADPAARDARAAAVAERLGISAGAPVLLFTPTWFDHLRHPGRVLRLTLDADLDRLRAAGGDDAWLLVRSHPAVPDRVGGRARHPRILDVSGEQDLVGLQLLADVAVTHASSLAVDTARTGTPLVVYDPPDAPIDEQGPLYLDLRTDGPWPVARDEEELLATVRTLLAMPPGGAAGAAGAVGAEAFLDAYGDVAQGGATAAVVDAMLS